MVLKRQGGWPLDLDWTDPIIHYLCIIVNGYVDNHYALNYKKCILNLRNVLNTWTCRKLTLKHNVTMVNNLALLLLLYVESVDLVHTPDIVFKEVKTIITDFVFCKPSKSANNTPFQPICKGGLILMDFES